MVIIQLPRLFSWMRIPISWAAVLLSQQISFLSQKLALGLFNCKSFLFHPFGVLYWVLNSYVNVTNQPTFGNGDSCDSQVGIYNTTLSTGQTGVKGNVTVATPYLPSSSTFMNVYGLRTDIAFIESNNVPCENLKGYSGTGSGDWEGLMRPRSNSALWSNSLASTNYALGRCASHKCDFSEYDTYLR